MTLTLHGLDTIQTPLILILNFPSLYSTDSHGINTKPKQSIPLSLLKEVRSLH